MMLVSEKPPNTASWETTRMPSKARPHHRWALGYKNVDLFNKTKDPDLVIGASLILRHIYNVHKLDFSIFLAFLATFGF